MKFLSLLRDLWRGIILLLTLNFLGDWLGDHDVPPFDDWREE